MARDLPERSSAFTFAVFDRGEAPHVAVSVFFGRQPGPRACVGQLTFRKGADLAAALALLTLLGPVDTEEPATGPMF